MSEPFTLREAFDTKRREVAELRRQLELAEAELRGMEAVASLLGSSAAPSEQSARVHRHTQGGRGDSRPARLKPTWLSIMRQLAGNPDGVFDLDELKLAIDLAGAAIGRNAARTQMYNYVQAGLLERLNPGQFKFTDAMRAAVQSSTNAETETAPAGEASAAS